MESSGVTGFAEKTGKKVKTVGEYIGQKVTVAGDSINQKIENSEKLKGYKVSLFKGIDKGSKTVNDGFNSLWNRFTKKKQQGEQLAQDVEELKDGEAA